MKSNKKFTIKPALLVIYTEIYEAFSYISKHIHQSLIFCSFNLLIIILSIVILM